ncbi:acyclic terpene utilization AtuA family protein [Actinoplanes sp. HUAS TT8]|uniref:acyclic terpene utilization AtuA family protein n=1 Tax=Actinoplanes sp. HUAS TT8 TaxID=3447453 RepID=UPI003F520136
MREMLEGGPLDYLTGDYLAELTMLILGRDRQKNPDLGYARTFLRQLADCLDLIKSRNVRIVSNAGGLHPAGLAAAIRALDPTLAVAHVEGDDLGKSRPGALTANAYLGAFGIAEAIRSGAQIVVTGRVTDASLTLGPAIAEFGWTRDDLDELAAGIAAGHVLECGTQATGGNFSGFTTIDIGQPLGFPIAQISAGGTVVITKHPHTGGAVTVDTVTAQLVYEIDSPRYLNPDVTTRLDTVQLVQEDKDQVKLFGVRGEHPPATTKVGINRLGGHRNTVTFVLTGLDIEEKAAWTRRQLEAALRQRPAELTWDLVRTDRTDPVTQAEASALLRCTVKDPDPAVVGRAFSSAAVELALASYPGFHVTAPPSDATPFGVFEAAYLPQSEVPHVVVRPDGTRADIAPPPEASAPPPDGPTPGPAARGDTPAGPHGSIHPPETPLRTSRDRELPAGAHGRSEGPDTTVSASRSRVPLGRLVHARSGDKGGAANVGVWVPAGHSRRWDAYQWLAGWLDADRVRELLPEAAELDVRVYALPNLFALNIVIDGLLGDGVAASTRSDPQAKAVGEWLRARNADIPTELLA